MIWIRASYIETLRSRLSENDGRDTRWWAMPLIQLSSHFVEKVWGGSKLAQYKGASFAGPIGETWEVSTLSQGPVSSVEGVPIKELLSNEELPYLIKFIEAKQNLSVQVHPHDEYAQKHENSQGKSEAWLILEAEEGAGLYVGLKNPQDAEYLRTKIQENGEVQEELHFFPVKKGEFYFLPAGSIHAIGEGVTLSEIQQSSGVTYRLWDWNRMGNDGKPRDLHLEKGLDVINFSSEFNQAQNFKLSDDVFAEELEFFHRDFKVSFHQLREGEKFELPIPLGRGQSLVVLEGDLRCGEKQLAVYQSYLRPHRELDKLVLEAASKSKFYVVS